MYLLIIRYAFQIILIQNKEQADGAANQARTSFDLSIKLMSKKEQKINYV